PLRNFTHFYSAVAAGAHSFPSTRRTNQRTRVESGSDGNGGNGEHRNHTTDLSGRVAPHRPNHRLRSMRHGQRPSGSSPWTLSPHRPLPAFGDEPCLRRSRRLGAPGLPQAGTQHRLASAPRGARRIGPLAAAASKRNVGFTPRRADIAAGTGARLQALAGPFCPRLPQDDGPAATSLAHGAADRESKAAARRLDAVAGPDRSDLRLCRPKPFHSGLRPAGSIEPRPMAPSLAQRSGRGVISIDL